MCIWAACFALGCRFASPPCIKAIKPEVTKIDSVERCIGSSDTIRRTQFLLASDLDLLVAGRVDRGDVAVFGVDLDLEANSVLQIIREQGLVVNTGRLDVSPNIGYIPREGEFLGNDQLIFLATACALVFEVK